MGGTWSKDGERLQAGPMVEFTQSLYLYIATKSEQIIQVASTRGGSPRRSSPMRSRLLSEDRVQPRDPNSHFLKSNGILCPSISHSPIPVAPLNVSRRNTPSVKDIASPRPSVASLRQKFDNASIYSESRVNEPLTPRKYGKGVSETSFNTYSTTPDYRPGRTTVPAR